MVKYSESIENMAGIWWWVSIKKTQVVGLLAYFTGVVNQQLLP